MCGIVPSAEILSRQGDQKRRAEGWRAQHSQQVADVARRSNNSELQQRAVPCHPKPIRVAAAHPPLQSTLLSAGHQCWLLLVAQKHCWAALMAQQGQAGYGTATLLLAAGSSAIAGLALGYTLAKREFEASASGSGGTGRLSPPKLFYGARLGGGVTSTDSTPGEPARAVVQPLLSCLLHSLHWWLNAGCRRNMRCPLYAAYVLRQAVIMLPLFSRLPAAQPPRHARCRGQTALAGAGCAWCCWCAPMCR